MNSKNANRKGDIMPYIPKEHEKYDLLPFCRERGGEVFQYPGELPDRLEEGKHGRILQLG